MDDFTCFICFWHVLNVFTTFGVRLQQNNHLAECRKIHNIGLVVTMLTVAILKLFYVAAADSFWMILMLTAMTAPMLKGANSVLDAQCLYAFPEKADFGSVRLWGSLGFGFLAFVTGWIVSGSRKSSNTPQSYDNSDGTFNSSSSFCFLSKS